MCYGGILFIYDRNYRRAVINVITQGFCHPRFRRVGRRTEEVCDINSAAGIFREAESERAAVRQDIRKIKVGRQANLRVIHVVLALIYGGYIVVPWQDCQGYVDTDIFERVGYCLSGFNLIRVIFVYNEVY